MGGSSKLDKLKAMQKEGKKGIVVDKTFGLKNKNKSKKVQQFCKQVQETQNKNKGIDAESKKKKKMSKLALTQRLFRAFPNFKFASTAPARCLDAVDVAVRESTRPRRDAVVPHRRNCSRRWS